MAQKQGQPRLAIRWVWVIKPAGERVWFYIVTMGWVDVAQRDLLFTPRSRVALGGCRFDRDPWC